MDGECIDCQRERRQTSHVIMWVRGTHIVQAGVFPTERPSTFDAAGSRVTLFTAKGPDARERCKAWYRTNLPSVERAYPIITLIAVLLLAACSAPIPTMPDASQSPDARHSIVARHPDAGGVRIADAHIVTFPDAFAFDASVSIGPDTARSEPDAACVGRCTFGGTSYYWQACPGEPMFRCGGGCDPRDGCIDAGPP